MNKIESLRRCYHCGAVLQSDNPEAEGYIDPEVPEINADKDILLCESCYKKQRYNRIPSNNQASDDFLTMIKDAKASDALIVNIIDLTSFECSFDINAIDLMKGLNYIVIGNKRDLIPEHYSDDDLKEYVSNVYEEYGLHIEKDDIYFTSLLSSSFDISEVADEVEKRRNGHDVYIIGDLSSGKSLFLNAFLKNYRNPSNHSVGVSRYFGTNLDVLKIPLDSTSFIYDTPGNASSNSFARYKDDFGIVGYIFTDKTYISKKIPVCKGGSIFISTLARLDYLEGSKKINVNMHFPPKIQIKAITPKKNMNELFLKYNEKKVLKPHTSFISSISDYDIFDIVASKSDEHQQITISGLGWLSFKTEIPTKFRIYVPKGIGIYVGKAKGHHKKC